MSLGKSAIWIPLLVHSAATRPVVMAQCELQRLTASDGASGDEFGGGVSISGDWLVVGAPNHEHAEIPSGSVYVFRRDDSGTPLRLNDDVWVEQAELIPANAQSRGSFGASVSMSGGRIVVGGHFDKVSGTESGIAYVFRRDDAGTPFDLSDDAWIEEAELTAAVVDEWPYYNRSVSMDGDRAVVGAFRDGEEGDGSGSAFVFRRDDNGTPSDPSDDLWVEESKLTASDGSPGDEFGQSVSISGGRIIVGAHFSDRAGSDSGSAYIFRRSDNGTPPNPNDDTWIEEAILNATITPPNLGFGRSVSIKGTRAIVGAPRRSGAAYMFHLDDHGTPSDPSDDLWIEGATFSTPDTLSIRWLGDYVSISGHWAIVGANSSGDGGSFSGSVYQFRLEDGGTPSDPNDDLWEQVDELVAKDPSEIGFLGSSVSVDGGWAIAGAPFAPSADQPVGAAYVYLLTVPDVDSDEDGVLDRCDNCPIHVNPKQSDCDLDGMGDTCAIAEGLSNDCNEDGVPDECPGCADDCECATASTTRASAGNPCARGTSSCIDGGCGEMTVVIDLALSPTIAAGPFTRCIEFAFSNCGGNDEERIVHVDVTFGGPFGRPGHGTAIIDVPAWSQFCVEAIDPLHTLMSAYSTGDSCGLGCVEEYVLNDPLTGEETNLGAVWHVSFESSPEFLETCHWLVNGNAHQDTVIDILDFVIWSGQFGRVVSADTPCGTEGLSADFNSDGVVNAFDFSFIVINFFGSNKEGCDELCLRASGAAVPQPRTSITVRELIAMGHGDAAGRADANGDGVVDVADMAAYVNGFVPDVRTPEHSPRSRNRAEGRKAAPNRK